MSVGSDCNATLFTLVKELLVRRLRTDSPPGRTKLGTIYKAGLALFLDNLFAVTDIQTLLSSLPVDLLTFEVVNLNVKNAVDGDAVNA